MGEAWDLIRHVRQLPAVGAICVMAAAIAPAARASSLPTGAQAEINSAEQLGQQMTANAQQTVDSGITAAKNAASNAVAGARQTIATALNQTAKLTPTSPSQTNGGSSSSSGTGLPPPQGGSSQGSPSPQIPSVSTVAAAAPGLAAAVVDQAPMPASMPQQASTHALKAVTGLAQQLTTRPGTEQPSRPASMLRRPGPPSRGPEDRSIPRSVPAEHSAASLLATTQGPGAVPQAPTSEGRAHGRGVGPSGHSQDRRVRRPAVPADDDSTAGSVTVVGNVPVSLAPPAGGVAGASAGGGGAAPAVALLAAFALSLLIAPSGRRMSLELLPWRSATWALPHDHPG